MNNAFQRRSLPTRVEDGPRAVHAVRAVLNGVARFNHRLERERRISGMQPADPKPSLSVADHLVARIAGRASRVAVIGLGYVGLPLAAAIYEAGFEVLGVDNDIGKLERLRRGESEVARLSAATLVQMQDTGRLKLSAQLTSDDACDVIIICVPTPLDAERKPDLSHIVQACEAVSVTLRRGQLVVLESTTYPGTTREVVKPILERTGLLAEKDFFLAYSPEREDPGNPAFATATTPKVVGPDGPNAGVVASEFYRAVVREVVAVENPDVAEAVKLTENVFRSVNIALANELKRVFGAMNIDIWDVVDAAATKPFGFMPFYPGPGSGGHCIPIDPVYLSWKARSVGIETELIDRAVKLNSEMPERVVDALEDALKSYRAKDITGSRVLVLGIAYKKNVADTRESPALAIMTMLQGRGASIDYHDPLVPVIGSVAAGLPLAGQRSVQLADCSIADYDAVLICTDHDGIDLAKVLLEAPLIIDTRNATRTLSDRSKVVPA